MKVRGWLPESSQNETFLRKIAVLLVFLPPSEAVRSNLRKDTSSITVKELET